MSGKRSDKVRGKGAQHAPLPDGRGAYVAPFEGIADGSDDLSEDYDDTVRQLPESDGDWKREWLEMNGDALSSAIQGEEKRHAASSTMSPNLTSLLL